MLFFTTALFAQQEGKSEKWLLTPSAGWGRHVVRDEARSPLRYQGNTFLGVGGFETRKKNRWHRYEAAFYAGRLTSAAEASGVSPLTSLLRLNIDGRVLFDIDPETAFPVHWHIGWGIQNTGSWRQNLRYSNNAHGYEWATSLSLEGYASHRLPLSNERRLEFGAGMRLPVVSAILYPAYNSVFIRGWYETSDLPTAIWKSLKIAMPSSFTRLNTECQASYFLRNGNALRLTYAWDFYRMQTKTPVTAAQHSLFFSTLFRL